jgi:hypothetical protein
MELECSLLCSHESWCRWIQSTSCHPISLASNYYLPIYAQVFCVFSSLHFFRPKCCMHFSSLPCMLYALPMSLITWTVFGDLNTCVTFRNNFFYGEELLARLSPPSMEYHPLIGCARLLLPYTRSYPQHPEAVFAMFAIYMTLKLFIFSSPSVKGIFVFYLSVLPPS